MLTCGSCEFVVGSCSPVCGESAESKQSETTQTREREREIRKEKAVKLVVSEKLMLRTSFHIKGWLKICDFWKLKLASFGQQCTMVIAAHTPELLLLFFFCARFCTPATKHVQWLDELVTTMVIHYVQEIRILPSVGPVLSLRSFLIFGRKIGRKKIVENRERCGVTQPPTHCPVFLAHNESWSCRRHWI